MDYEDFLANNIANNTEYVYHATAIEIVFEVIQCIICWTGTLVDILMIYIILRYKNMKKPLNIYILNWLINDAILVFMDPSLYRIYTMVEGFSASKQIICLMHMSLINIRTSATLFMLVILLHWFFSNTKVTLFERHCGKVVAAVWTFSFALFLVISSRCFFVHVPRHFGEMFQAFVLLVFLICLVTIHCIRRCANPFSTTSSLAVALSTSLALTWLTMLIFELLLQYIDTRFFIVIFYRGQVVIYLYPLIIFYLYYRIDPNFAACAEMLFNRSHDANACSEDMMEDRENDNQITNSREA